MFLGLLMDYMHFVTALTGGIVVVVACLSQYGVNAPTVIFCTQWGLVASTWFITTLPAMNNFMRGIAWSLFVCMVLLLGRQIPYMINSRSVGESFYDFMIMAGIFIIALIVFAHTRENKQ